FEPATLLGTIAGVLCNVMFPDWLIVSLIIIVLTLTTFRTGWKGISMIRNELNQKGEIQNVQDAVDYSLMTDSEQKDTDQNQLRLQALLAEESRTPWFKIFVICISWVIVFVFQLLKGGHGAPSIAGIPSCSVGYWVLVTASFPVIGLIVVLCAIYLLVKHKQKVKIGYVFHKGDIHWNLRNTFLYSIFCGFAGFFAG